MRDGIQEGPKTQKVAQTLALLADSKAGLLPPRLSSAATPILSSGDKIHALNARENVSIETADKSEPKFSSIVTICASPHSFVWTSACRLRVLHWCPPREVDPPDAERHPRVPGPRGHGPGLRCFRTARFLSCFCIEAQPASAPRNSGGPFPNSQIFLSGISA